MIVGTAGHIDHGKTTLVQALTGVDTDRLPEEKARGMSIELGYAFLDVPGDDERIGFVDVPGHERFVHTMLAGATGIDFALLLVAADDGLMPQTREHVAVLALLGVSAGVVVVTKTDRADPLRIAAVTTEIARLLAGTSLADLPVVAVSARTGDGIERLRERLFDAARRAACSASTFPAQPARPDDAPDEASFRLAIDRVFTLVGIGTVVTGTVHAGRVHVGDELAFAPSDRALRARVRSLHAQNRSVGHARAGQRCAVALAGIARDEIERGQWLVSPSAVVSTDRIDATLSLWRDEARPLRSGTGVQVHLGSGEVPGTIAILRVQGQDATSSDMLPPGTTAQVQIVLRQPIAAWHGDRLVLRDASASRTLAGGIVLDPFGPARYRRTPQRLGELAAWALPDAAARLAALVDSSPLGVSLSRWRRAEGRSAGFAPPLPPGALHIEAAGPDGPEDWALAARHAKSIASSVVTALDAFHQRDPEVPGPDSARLRRSVAPRLAEALWRALLADLQRQASIAVHGAWVHLPAHGLRLSDVDQRLAQKVLPLLASAGFEGSWARDLARAANESEPLMRTTLARLAQRGALHQVVKDLYYSPPTVGRLAEHARALAHVDDGSVTAAGFRDATGLGRKRAIQILEYFDRIGLLRRVGDAHLLRKDTALFRSAEE